MTDGAQAVLQQAVKLDAIERAELIEALFRSFDKGGDRDVDAKWAKEAESRIDAFDRGDIASDSADNVLRRIGKQ